MYDFLCGELTHIGADGIVLATGGVGYRLSVPATAMQRLRTRLGETVTLYTHLHVTEPALRLFGFASREERDLFLLLQTVTGVGPSLALALLGAGPWQRLAATIAAGEPAPLLLVKGVGRKTAQRLCLELKDKVPSVTTRLKSVLPDLVGALTALGYGRAEALRAAEKALEKLPGEDDLEKLLKRALQEGQAD
ncbi:MAG: Holliday junction branch migration protein RuvA [Planctomycetota bacterium]